MDSYFRVQHSLTLTLTFTLVLTLTGLWPVSVFAQTATPTDDELTEEVVDDVTTETATATEAVPESTGTLSDPYRRSSLPTEQVYSDFVIGPGKFEIELAPGESETVMMNISNRMGETKRFSFEFEDMTGSADGERAVILLGDERGPYSLRDYISIPAMEFDLEHATRAQVPITISIPADAEPGGHYGSVVVSTVTRPGEVSTPAGTPPTTPIVSRIGALFFVTAPGEQVREGELLDFDTVNERRVYTEGPVPFTLVYENTGSVHLNPYGEIRVTNILGQEVGFIELEPWFAMPESVRLREVNWDRELLFGKYTATAYVNRGYEDIVDEQTVTFYVLPWQPILITFAVIFIVFWLFRFFFSTFEFKRKS